MNRNVRTRSLARLKDHYKMFIAKKAQVANCLNALASNEHLKEFVKIVPVNPPNQ